MAGLVLAWLVLAADDGYRVAVGEHAIDVLDRGLTVDTVMRHRTADGERYEFQIRIPRWLMMQQGGPPCFVVDPDGFVVDAVVDRVSENDFPSRWPWSDDELSAAEVDRLLTRWRTEQRTEGRP